MDDNEDCSILYPYKWIICAFWYKRDMGNTILTIALSKIGRNLNLGNAIYITAE